MTLTNYLFITAIVVGAFSQTCSPPSPDSDQLDAGQYTFLRNNFQPDRENCYNANVKYQMPSSRTQVAVSTSTINGYNPQGGLDYTVRGTRRGGTNTVLFTLFITSDQRWASVVISYLISSRTDIMIGSFAGLPIELSKCNINLSNGKGTVETFLPTYRLDEKKNYRVAAFISGYRTQASIPFINIVTSAIDRADGRLVTQYETTANPSLEIIYIHYVVYPEVHDVYTFVYNGNPSQRGTLNWQGIKSFNQYSLDVDQFVICRSSGPCKLLQVLVGNQCQCRPGLVNVQGACRNLCAPNAYLNDFSQCQCIPGYVRNAQNICTQSTTPTCPPNQSIIPGTANCACNVGYYRHRDGTCVSFCQQQNQVFDGRQCVCKEGFFTTNTGACIANPSCPQPNEVFGANGCQCIAGYIRNQNQQCILIPTCGQNEVLILVNNQCQCQQGFTRNQSQQCVRIPTCGQNEVLVNNQCQCQQGFTRNQSQQCVRVVTCAQNQVLVNNQCVCRQGFTDINGACIPNQSLCPTPDFQFNPQTRRCQCKPGFRQFFGQCTSICAINEEYIDNNCRCKAGHSKLIGVCRPCPSNSDTNSIQTTCVCKNNRQIFDQQTLQCKLCQANASPNNDRTACVCNGGFTYNNGQCVQINTCPSGSFPIGNGQCICQLTGRPPVSGSCQITQCPQNAVFDTNQFKCICLIPNQRIVDGKCQGCGNNESWNGTDCICIDKFFKINGVCRTCDINTNYNGQDCVCNRGFFGNRDQCNPCHASCGTCSGPAASQCITCADISYVFENGFCTTGSNGGPCPVGTYLQGSNCQLCNEYCNQCQSALVCQKCSDGFNLFSLQGMVGCVAVCGDGKRVDYEECDDNNTRDNDGCSSDCFEEEGWTCTGGNSNQKSFCSQFTPSRSIIEVKGSVNLIGRVVVGVKMSYIPTCFTDQDCINCHKILQVKVVKSQVSVVPKVIYVPKNKGQFFIQFDTNQVITNFLFTYSIRINRQLDAKYLSCFSQEDLAQYIQREVQTATLSRFTPQQSMLLSLDDVNDPTLSIPSGALDILQG